MEMRKKPSAGEFYRHFKGGLYQIQGIAKHTETGEEMVVYQALYGAYEWYVRPLSMFLEKVDREKYPNAGQQWRFEKEVLPLEEKEILENQDETETREKEQDMTGGQKEESAEKEPAAEPEEGQVAPVLLAFLEAETLNDKLEILRDFGVPDEEDSGKKRILYAMAASVELEAGERSARRLFEDLESYLMIRRKYEKVR